MFLKKLAKAFAHLAYPPQCLHCGDSVSNPDPLFCESCSSLLEVINPIERCQFCFKMIGEVRPPICESCRHTPHVWTRVGAVFDYLGPAATLVSRLKYSDMHYLAKGMGAYLAGQFMQLEWPMPDCIVPAPITLTHLFVRGYNQSELLAQSLGAILGCPVQNALSRKSGDYSQAGLNRSQRGQLGQSIFLKQNHELQDKCVLLVDDVLTTGSTMKRCTEALLAGYPKSIYALTFCKTIE